MDLSRLRHDLRTPINHILGYCEMLQEDELTPAAFQADLDRIHSGGRKLLALITEYFDEELFDTRQPDLTRLCHELRTPVNHIIGYSELLRDEADNLQLEKLPADLKRITDAARTWLGLMEGYLIAPATQPETAPPGSVELLAEAIGFTPPPPIAGLRPPIDGRLLVADDDEGNRDMLARRLRRQGLTVSVAANGLDALQLARAQPFDLVILDMLMPGLDGIQVLMKLKSDPFLASVPVVMISALDQEDSVARCLELGADDYITKPFNPVLLRARLEACLEKKRLRTQEALFLRQIQEEQRRTDELLHVILPRDVAAELKATQTVQPRRFDPVGVLFCDIVGFAAYSDRRPPEEIVRHLQSLVETFEDIATRHGLEKIKTIGDSFMAAAGLLGPAENPALNCVRCGLDMIAAVRGHPASWQVRVGVHAGPVVAGVVGRKKYQYDVWGDTVNTAARVEQAGDPGTVCVTSETWQAIAACAIGESKGRLPIKGKGILELFRVTALTKCP